jgi:branched-chain amino acid transport system ATP-binding protein
MLEVKNIQVCYGKVKVIDGVSFEVNKGEVVVIIGANGAGKTTTLKTITGLLTPTSGSIMFKGKEISGGFPAEKIVEMGLAMCPEGRQVFPKHTVAENLLLGGYTIRKDKKLLFKRMEEMYEIYPVLKQREKQTAGTLSGGEQQMLAIARAMMSGPELLLLDEPSAGLAPIFVNGVFEMITKLSKSGTTILLVEQMANMALKISDRAYVLENGKISMGGTSREISQDSRVIESYLGKKA